MLTGTALFAEAYPFLKQTVLTWGNFGKLTLPHLLGVNHWLIIPLMILGNFGLFYCSEKFKVQSSRFKVKSKGRHELFLIYGWAKGP
jgi:hypothetical protein